MKQLLLSSFKFINFYYNHVKTITIKLLVKAENDMHGQ